MPHLGGVTMHMRNHPGTAGNGRVCRADGLEVCSASYRLVRYGGKYGPKHWCCHFAECHDSKEWERKAAWARERRQDAAGSARHRFGRPTMKDMERAVRVFEVPV